MADNITLPGTGVAVAADDVASAFYQRFKLHTSEDGSAEGIGDTDKGTSRALWVESRPDLVRHAVASSGLTTSVTAYSSGDQLGTIFELTNAVKAAGGFGEIRALRILDKADVVAAIDIVLLRASITLAGDNAAFAISDTDAESVVDIVSMPYALDIGNNRFSSLSGLAIPFDATGTSLYAALITRAGHTFFGAATDLVLGATIARL